MNLLSKLTLCMSALGFDSPGMQENAEKLIRYVELMGKWNRVHNLTSVRKPDEMLTHHIVDSLAVLPYLIGDRLADVGSGAGLPGIPIAILKPHWQITLIESNQKKTAFLQQVKFELRLENIQVIVGRAEEFQPFQKYNIVICRALCSLRNFILLAGHLRDNASKENRLVVMKGGKPEDELKQLPENYFIEKIFPIVVPGLSASRHLIFINEKDDS